MSVLQFGLTPKTKPLSPKRSALVAALDVGTSKIACLIARLKPQSAQDVLRRRSHTVEVVGFGHTLCARHQGRRGGRSRRPPRRRCARPIDLAERSAKLQLESVMVSMSAGKPASELMSASVDVTGSTVADRDIARVMAAGSQHSARPGRAVLHSLPIGYTLDDVTGIRDPRGMLGAQLRHRHARDDRRHVGRPQPDATRSRAATSTSRRWWRAPMRRRCRCWPTTRPISARP